MKPKPNKPPENANQLAKALGVSRQLIAVHVKHPDHPPFSDVNAWNVFLAAHGKEGSGPPDLKRKLAEKRLEILTETKRQLARENEEAERSVISKAEVSTGIKAGVALMFSELDRLFLNELPPALKGLDELAIKGRCAAAIGKLRDTLREKFAKLETK